MAKHFDGKRVFVTGASSGIGAATAIEFARQGACVALAARRGDRLEQVRDRIAALGGRALALTCDVTDAASLRDAVDATVAAFGGIDVVLANAGFPVVGPFDALDTAAFRRQFDVNVFGVVDTIYAALPHLIASKGQLAIVSSVIGRMAVPDKSAYCASKFALCGLAEALQYDLAAKGIAVTCINPGGVHTEIYAADNDNVRHDEPPKPRKFSWAVASPERAARAIVRAIRKRKPEAVITFNGKAMVFLHRHVPALARGVIRFLAR